MNWGFSRRAGACIALLLLLVLVPAAAVWGQTPEFSFWGNLPSATRLLEYNPDTKVAPVPVVDVGELAQCRITLAAPLHLIRNGVVVGQGRVGEIRAGWLPRAGDDRVVYFVPVGLPDSVVVVAGRPSAVLIDPDFDFYVVGGEDVHLVTPLSRRAVADADFADAVEGAIEDKALVSLHFPSWVNGQYSDVVRVPELPDAVVWLRGKTEALVFEVATASGGNLPVLDCSPFFVRLMPAGDLGTFYFRGTLDYFVTVDDVCYMVMRSGKPGSGAWGYAVYRVGHEATPVLVYSDGSWST